jgi:hypothetical protein
MSIDNPIGPFSGVDSTDFVGPLVGMFLEDTLPTSAPPSFEVLSQRQLARRYSDQLYDVGTPTVVFLLHQAAQ